jgi:hypothetical protein
MKIELIETYHQNLTALNRGEKTVQQWNDVCLWILGQIMDQPENKLVMDRLDTPKSPAFPYEELP